VHDQQIGSLQTIHNDFYVSQNLYNSITQNIYISAANTTQRKHPDSLRDKISRIFGVGLETADCTLNATTQLAIRNSVHPIQRHYRTEVAQLRYPRLGGQHGRFTQIPFSPTHQVSVDAPWGKCSLMTFTSPSSTLCN
jgi:hypothetical protein